jgi:CRISPR-associated protein Cas8b/Csh1 subtype I-B
MDLDFFNDFKDPYMKSPRGQGIFLAGVLLGYIAYKQAGGKNEDDITKAPLFKQIQFGRMDMKTLKRLLARVPQLIAAYREDIGKSMNALTYLSAKVGEMLLSDGTEELGIEGNFAFATGFVNANNYYWKMFSKKDE